MFNCLSFYYLFFILYVLLKVKDGTLLEDVSSQVSTLASKVGFILIFYFTEIYLIKVIKSNLLSYLNSKLVCFNHLLRTLEYITLLWLVQFNDLSGGLRYNVVKT